MATIETKLNEKGAKSLEPGTGSLLEDVESFLQVTYMIGKARINVPEGLLYIYMFIDMAIEKHILAILLTKGQFVGHNKKENNTDCGGLNDKAKGVNAI